MSTSASPDRPAPPLRWRDAIDAAETGPLTPLERLVLLAYVLLRSEANRSFTPAGVAALTGLTELDVRRAGHELHQKGLIRP